jgi:hypothetical protein
MADQTRVAVNGYGVIGKRVADAVVLPGAGSGGAGIPGVRLRRRPA